MRRLIGSILAAIALAASATALAAPAGAVPQPGTTVVAPSLAACQTPGETPRANVACAAALTNVFLRAQSKAAAVRQTVIVAPPAAGVSYNPGNGDLCAYAEIGRLSLGMHHCNGVTYVSPSASGDAGIIARRSSAIAALLHESSHGVQELAGLRPVSTTLFGTSAQIKRLELSSDCWAGVGVLWLTKHGYITKAVLAQARTFMAGLSDSHGHGDGLERVGAFDRGNRGGPGACNAIIGVRGVYPRSA